MTRSSAPRRPRRSSPGLRSTLTRPRRAGRGTTTPRLRLSGSQTSRAGPAHRESSSVTPLRGTAGYTWPDRHDDAALPRSRHRALERARARRALEAGAKDFISKPFDLVEVQTRIHNLLEVRLLYKNIEDYNKVLEQTVQERTGELLRANEQLSQEIEERKGAEKSLQSAYAEIKQLKDRFQAENIYLQQDIDREFNFGEIIGRSNALVQVFLRVEQVAPQDTTILLLGETGTGKGVVARAIHSRSAYKDRPLVTVNCTALPANLIESELFGRERGAVTGSDARQMGRFELQDS
ncbi:MAG: sigma 54-interacting transcriptional regulator [Acidobacteria bacterium]|nr:sigma 54-interacting transcriptional regulator [Acidobacteriota bacterium]